MKTSLDEFGFQSILTMDSCNLMRNSTFQDHDQHRPTSRRDKQPTAYRSGLVCLHHHLEGFRSCIQVAIPPSRLILRFSRGSALHQLDLQAIQIRQSGARIGEAPPTLWYHDSSANCFPFLIAYRDTRCQNCAERVALERHLQVQNDLQPIAPFPETRRVLKGFRTPHTVFVQSNQTLHKERRRLLNPFFARAGVFRIEPVIHSHVRNLQEKLTKLSTTGKSLVAQKAFRCVTVDIITDFAFAESRHLVDNSDESFNAPSLDTFDTASDILWDSIYSPRFREFGTLLPKKLSTPR